MTSPLVRSCLLLFCTMLFIVAPLSFAINITGTVTNKTVDKASPGDDVVLLKLSGGMQEAARTKADNQGKFTLPGPEDEGPDRKSTRLNSSHRCISYAVFCLKKKKK